MKLHQVIKHYGTITKAATALGFTRQALWLWRTKGIPNRTQRLIQMATMGELKAEREKK